MTTTYITTFGENVQNLEEIFRKNNRELRYLSKTSKKKTEGGPKEKGWGVGEKTRAGEE